MIRVLRKIGELAELPGPVYLAIGVFDGVHLGHRKVIAHCLEKVEPAGTAVVVTFEPHPAALLAPDRAPALLTSLPQKLTLLEEVGVEHALVLPFTKEFASIAAHDFVAQLVEAADPLGGICVGWDWTFGKGGAGNLALLKTLGDSGNFEVIAVEAIEDQGAVVSSTRIRAAVAAGGADEAERLLLRPHAVEGVVVEGRKLGRTIGFPTANLQLDGVVLPPNGVYAVVAHLEEKKIEGVANLGVRPTVEGADSQRVLEVHLFEDVGEIYGVTLQVAFCQQIREEKKFESIDALTEQIQRDVVRAKAILDI